ncbi:MAG: HAMP domain-containing protein [Bryobacteraceae bacterium]|nr:HAMP domain-containing protein [Bryobacteraceae bacterium]
MKQRYKFGFGLALLLILTGLVIWQGSFSVGDYGPASPQQTYVFWGLSTLIFLLTVLLAFMLFRDAVKLYVARRAGQEGSRIRTKIVIGALTLTFLPMLFLVLWSVEVLNRNLDKWFSRPGERVTFSLVDVAKSLEGESRRHADALARWVAGSEELRGYLETGHPPREFLLSVCESTAIEEAHVVRPDGGHLAICEEPPVAPRNGATAVRPLGMEIAGRAPIAGELGEVAVRIRMPLDLEAVKQEIDDQVRDYSQLALTKRETRRFYLQLLLLITLFILFVATWVALFLARQITSPLTAVLEAARAVRSGNLAHRVRVQATDELATLVRAFNEMTQDLETNRDELERRRRFIEAVLESIPTGVISLAHDGAIQLTNNALRQIFPEERLRPAARLSDLLTSEQQRELARLLGRARRRGSASGQIELEAGEGAARQVTVTVSALDELVTSGFVMVLDDTTELLRAQKAAAWHEVARRIAHELKNPLTPIALSSERILRQLDKCQPPPEVHRIIHECCATIGREVQSVKSLVDEFARFARFPTAQPVPADLNAVVREALAVFEGRLDGITLRLALAGNLPPVALDAGQFKRVVVNLVDNAAEAMRDAPLRELLIETSVAGESVELVIADTGCGISTGDKAKLFLPDFSTKNRGTGVGLAIVSHIVGEHGAQIRVEDNRPAGARFIIELPALSPADSAGRVLSHS